MLICKNCSNKIPVNEIYCGSCGARFIHNRLTLKGLFHEVISRYFNWDNQLIKTIKHMFSKPEKVITSFTNGVRKRYINPVSFFALSVTISGLYIFISRKFFPELMTFDLVQGQEMENNPAFEYQTLMAFMFIPLYALLSKIIFYKVRSFNYTEHLVFFLYTAGQLGIIGFVISMIMLGFGVNFYIAAYYSILIQILFNAYCFKRTFELSIGKIIWKTVVFILLMILTVFITGVIMYVTGLTGTPPTTN